MKCVAFPENNVYIYLFLFLFLQPINCVCYEQNNDASSSGFLCVSYSQKMTLVLLHVCGLLFAIVTKLNIKTFLFFARGCSCAADRVKCRIQCVNTKTRTHTLTDLQLLENYC